MRTWIGSLLGTPSAHWTISDDDGVMAVLWQRSLDGRFVVMSELGDGGTMHLVLRSELVEEAKSEALEALRRNGVNV